MPLILAVEPNNSQAQQLTSLVRQYLKAELITAPSAQTALQALGDRIPDLILTPALLAPRDEAALTERLRELGTAAAHVQTLAVPILASKKSRPAIGGILGRKRDKEPSEPVGCHPSVFAEQIQIYLERAASEQAAVTGVSAAEIPALAALVASDASVKSDEAAGDDDDTLDVIFDMPVEPLTPPAPAVPVDPAADDLSAAPPAFDAPAPYSEPAGTHQSPSQPPPAAGPERAPQARVAEELGLLGAPAGTPLWRIAEDVEDFYRGTASFAPAPESAEKAPEQAIAAAPSDAPVDVPVAPAAEVEPAPTTESDEVVEVDLDAALTAPAPRPADPAAARTSAPAASATSGERRGAKAAPPPPPQKNGRHKKKGAPPSDDWTSFDASQGPFKALVRRLDEIAGHATGAR